MLLFIYIRSKGAAAAAAAMAITDAARVTARRTRAAERRARDEKKNYCKYAFAGRIVASQSLFLFREIARAEAGKVAEHKCRTPHATSRATSTPGIQHCRKCVQFFSAVHLFYFSSVLISLKDFVVTGLRVLGTCDRMFPCIPCSVSCTMQVVLLLPQFSFVTAAVAAGAKREN